MANRAVADTGPLVAIVRTREEAHMRCADALKALRAPLLTCWPVLTRIDWMTPPSRLERVWSCELAMTRPGPLIVRSSLVKLAQPSTNRNIFM